MSETYKLWLKDTRLNYGRIRDLLNDTVGAGNWYNSSEYVPIGGSSRYLTEHLGTIVIAKLPDEALLSALLLEWNNR